MKDYNGFRITINVASKDVSKDKLNELEDVISKAIEDNGCLVLNGKGEVVKFNIVKQDQAQEDCFWVDASQYL